MKRLLLLSMMTLVLAACGNGPDTTEEPDGGASEEQGDSAGEGETSEEAEEAEEPQETAEIIDEAVSAWGETSSYEARQTFTISSDDDQSVMRTITTQSDQDEVKIEVDNGTDVMTHYVIGGDHFIYQDGEITEQEGSVDMSGSEYGEIVSQLESFEDGDAASKGEGYEIQYPIESAEDAAMFIDEETLSTLDGAESLNGLITLELNEEYQYTRGELTLTVTIDGEEINMISNIEMSRIDDISVIEKPKNM